MGKRSQSCLAIRGSRSQTATILQSLSLCICATWASATLPHPTMATLSMLSILRTALEKAPQSLRGGHFWLPAQPGLQFLVGVTRFLPVSVPSFPIEGRWQLPLRPLEILLPEIAKSIANRVGHVDRSKASYILFVQMQILPARRKVIVDYVKDLSIYSPDKAGQHDCVSAVVNVGKRNRVGPADM